MDIPLIGGDKIRSLIKNATKDSSTGSNESLIKTNTRDGNNLIKDSNQLEMDRKNKIVIDNLNKGGNIITKSQGLFKGLKNSEAQNTGGGINVSQGGNLNNSEIKSRGLNIESDVNNVNDINNANVNNNIEGIRINKNNGVLTNPSNGRINGWGGGGGGWGDEGQIENETIGESKRMSQAVVDLYKVAGRLNEREEELDMDKLRNSFSEFDELTDDVLGDLVADLKVMNAEGDEDLLKIIEAYPELGKVRLSDLNDASKAALLGGLVDGDDSKWGLVDYVLFAPNLISKGFGGKKMTDYRGDFADWAYDSKKMIQYTQKDEGEFLKDLHNKYAEYTNANGEWLPNATPEIKKQYKKEWDEYERKATLNNVGNSIANFFKGLPKVVDIALNIANHPEDLIKTLPRLVAGAPATGTEWIADKIEEKTGNNFLDKLAQRKGVETWQEMKEMMYDKASKGKGAFNKVAAWVIGSSEVSDGMREYIVDSYGSEENFVQTLVERPEDVISDAISIAEGAVGIAKGAGIIDAARAEMIIKNLGYFDMYEMSTKGAFKAEKRLAKQELDLAKKGLGKTMKNTEKFGGLLKRSPIGKMVSFVENKLTGLSEEERKFIRENGDIVEEYLKGNKSAEEIADMIMSRFDDLIEGKKAVGQFYDFIKNNEKLTVKTSGIVSGIKGLLKELGIKIDRKGNLKFGALSYTPAQQRQLQQVYNYVKALEGLGDTATAKDVRRARQLIDSLINWEGNTKMGLDAEVMNSIRNMRSKIDDALKEQVKGFKEADAEYRELTNLVKELKKDWFTKDGKLKDNALSKIRNLTNKGNEAKLERLEKQFPGITRALKGLGVSQSIEKASKMMVGQYAQQLLIGGGLWKLINGDLSVATALIGAGILTPKNLVKILKKEGDFMSKWRSVADNLSNGKVLSDEKINRLKRWLKDNSQEIGQKVAEEEGGKGWEKVDMDKVDLEYEKGQKKAYAGGKVTEKKLTKDERASLLKKYAKGSENNGFLMKIVDSMGEGEHGLTDLDNKLIKLEQNPGDTTIQHEFFHALFSVIDDDTKKYVINEVKNYLGLTDDVAAEERLAESFGIYARRREIKLGNIRLKGNRLQRFRSRISDLFQRAYEWIQDYSMDRKTINKLFNEVYGAVDGKVLDETGKFNLAEKLGINEKSSKLGGLEGEGLRYKKTGNLGKNDYTTTNGQEDRLLLGGLSTTEGGMKQATHAEGGRGNRGPQKAHLERVSSSDTANFFEHTDNKGRGYIEYNNGGGKVEKLYKQHELFDGYSEKLNKGLSKYKENLVKINDELAKNSSKKTSAVIGKTGHGKDIMISKEGLSHIYKHGNLDFNTLINAINDPTNQKQEIMGGRYRLEVRLDDGDTLVVGLQPKERVKGGKVKDVNSRVDADLYTVTSVTKGKPRGAESLEVRLKRDAKGRELSKGQQEYFKDSKVRDANGGLLRMFHGTPNKGINVFNKSKIGTSTDSGVWGRGFYFTPDESYAEKYTKRNGNVGEIKEAYIDIKKPFEIDLNDKATIDKFNESYMKYSPNLEDVWKKGLQKKYGELIDQGYEKGTQALKDAGYDGVIVKRGGEIKEVVAFEPNQIKNIDNLNPSISDDIRYKKTGKGEGVDYNSTNLYGKIDQNGLTKKEGGSFGKLGAKGLSQGNGLDRGANKGVLQETSLTKLGAGKGGDGTSQKLVNVKDGSEMVKISQNLQNKQERGAFMDVHSAEEYNTYKNFTNKNKSATISVKPDGDIINFVSTEKGAGKDLMLRAIEEGGNKMDNYGVGLTSYYENFGFEPVARVKFNREYAPNNWNFVRDGEPDIFVMKHNGDSVDVVREKYGTYKHKTPEELDKLPVMEYDDALKYRDELQAKEGKGLRYKKAYHGSPADFDRFDSSHMSEGEGNQAHGWGHYVAINKDTAKLEYADMNKEMKYTYNGKTSAQMINSSDKLSIKDQVAKDVLFDVSYQNNRYPTLDDAIKHNEEVYKARIENLHNGDFSKQYISRHENILNEKLNELKTIKNDIKKEFDSNLYEVEIPDPVKKDTPTGSNYLEEDGKITDKELNKFRELMNKEYSGRGDRFMEDAIIYKVKDGKGLYKELSHIYGEKGASMKLNEWGYDGIHYFGGRDGEAYVIFNDDAPQIQNHIRYKRAYHGSPAEFDRFDMEHMGEGEGGASHGWGLYFAKDKDIAKERYAERSHKYGISYEGGTLEEIKKKADEKGFYNLDIKDRVAYRLMNETKGDNMFNRFVDFDSAKEKSLSLIDDKISLAEYVIKNKGKDSITDKIYNEAMDSLPKLKEEKKVISNMKNGDFGIGEAKDRNLYAVDIPDEIKKDTPTGSNYFRESRTYNKQELGAILEKFKEKYPDKYDLLKNKFNTPLHGRRVYTSIADVLGGQKQASKFLESIGYDGVYAKGYIDKDVYVMFNNKGLDVKDHIRYKKDQTKTPEFRKWFEGSKVVKADGKPQVVYHGTTADFNVFNKIGGAGIYGDGYYFTDKIGTAKNYGADGGKVMKVYLDIKNPYEATMKDQYGLNIKKLKEQGYDGVKAKLGNETYWVAFDSNQIKSATDNVGTFDKSNPDIRYKKDNTDKRKDSYKMGLSRKAGNKLWEESINPSTGKKWTKEEIDKAVLDFKDEVLGDEKKLKQVYNEYIKNDELGEDVRGIFDIKGYINPDAVRPVVNKMLSKKYGVSDNILASVNHPASSKIADGIRDMIYDKSIEKAKKGEKVVVSTISGGGGSGKSKGPKALIKNGYIKNGKVDITLDVQKGADDLKLLIDKARKEGVLDKYEFDVAYVYAPVEDASKGVGIRTANQNAKGLGGLGKVFDVDRIIKELGWGDEELDRVYKGRSLPMSVFEEGHKKSAGEKGLQGFVKMSEEMDNFNLIITKRNGKGVDVVNVKKGGEFLIDKGELTKLVDEINTNKNGGINMDRINKDMEKLYKEGRISRRQYMNLISGLGLFVILFGGGSEE